MISISTSFPPALSTSLQSSIKSISFLVPDEYFWTPWSTVLWGGKQGSGAAASVSQLKAALTQYKTCECGTHLSLPPLLCLLHSVLPFVLLLMGFSLLIEPKMPTELGLRAFAEAKQLLSNLLRFDLSLTVMGTNVLSSREAVSWMWRSLLSWRGTAQAISRSEHMFLLDFMHCLLQMFVN